MKKTNKKVNLSLKDLKHKHLQERMDMVELALKRSDGNVRLAAQLLETSRSQVYLLMRTGLNGARKAPRKRSK